jgi:dienelactone hydrolase
MLADAHQCKELLKTSLADLQIVIAELNEINKHDPKNIFTDLIDVEKIGILGHSFGGSLAIALCATTKQCKVGISMEGGPLCDEEWFSHHFRLQKPFLFLLASDNTSGLNQAVDALISDSKNVEKVIIKDADHNTFGDSHLIFPSKKYPLMPKKAHVIITPLLVNFFDTYLKNGAH